MAQAVDWRPDWFNFEENYEKNCNASFFPAGERKCFSR